ncbi:murein transglycosylase [Azospirillum thiophilum]|uniref:Murein transglycosylase n=1 Tax=Azospirillum thiophilum TaxID=528244 RepID=A0AAC8ZTX2_9PROT|nr:lytic murein transglycosylase [Azospirillum thiophilum]ALG71348.1 murein transglycosylase [Azospirillum thiophilum]KJR64998.1 murein transglycosylase [Azospirillum thiophilum]
MRLPFRHPARLLLATLLMAGCQSTGATAPANSGGASPAAAAPLAQPAAAQPASFPEWLAALRAEALAQGIRAQTFDRAFQKVKLSDRVVELDSSQPEFTRQVWQYLDSAVNEKRVQDGRQKLQDQAALLSRITRRTGVPGEILVAFWGVESDFGKSTGNFAVIDALTTLAFEGRRAAYFRSELLAALRILESGDIAPERMSGSWAGAMGQTQFMPSVFLRNAVDEDGDGHRDIWGSMPDVLASTAKFVLANGWKSAEPWGQEVRLPDGFPYDQAELSVVKPLSDWRRLGVVPMDGTELGGMGAGGDAPAAILVLAGHRGPAFLVRDNFRAIMRYNPSTSYALAVALLADRMVGKPGVRGGWPREEQPLSRDERIDLQQRLAALGMEPGAADGIVGANTRNAVRRFQASIGEIPDGFATKALLERLRQRS